VWYPAAMSARSLGEKVKEEAVGHTAWHFTGEKLLDFIERRWKESLGAAISSGLTLLWGYLRGFSRLKLTAISMGTAVVVLLIWDVIAKQRNGVGGRGTSSSRPPERLGEIRFDYPGSPLDRWEFSSDDPKDKSMPNFSAAPERVGGLRMSAPWSHHLDLKLEPHYRVCDRLQFDMKLSRESYVYAKILLTSRDGKTISKPGWIACDIGNKPPAKYFKDE